MSQAPHTTTGRLAIVGTAGHIDHGKTAMVHRLTGVDTDRLPEEKKRGISIDLGFAPLVTPAGVRVGIVDVPGHERFVKNMLAGVGGIDVVLLVIAADEGVMPQTREHFAIVKLLGVTRGIVVLTKSDLVDEEWLELVRRDARALVEGTPLAGAPIIAFSAVTGAGQKGLLAELDRQLAQVAARPADATARLPVDRVFTMEGFGTVVTGTLWRGVVRTGDTLDLMPAGHAVRVRRIQVHGATVEEAHAGQRTALALHGVDRAQVARGQWLITPGSLRPSFILDVRFELLPDVPKAWPPNSRVRFHLGASEIIGRLVLLEAKPIEPGASALAQLRLEKPTVAARGDRFVIRAYSPMRTIGGGTVIEPVASKRRRHAAGLEQLAVHESGSIEARLLEKLAGEKRPASTAMLAQAVSEPEVEVGKVLTRLADNDELIAPVEGRWIGVETWRVARDAIEAAVRRHVAAHPETYGIAKGELKSGLKATVDPKLFDPAFEAMVRDGVLDARGEYVRQAGEPWEPPAAVLAALEKLEHALEDAGLSVPEVGTWPGLLGKLSAQASALGFFMERLVRVNQDLAYTPRQLDDLRRKLVAHFAKNETLSVGDLRTLTGVSRKYGVPLLEHCDRVGWTVRIGDARKAGGRLQG